MRNMTDIPVGRGKQLFLYSDLYGFLCWAKDMPQARDLAVFQGKDRKIQLMRVAHKGIPAPAGYHKPAGELAFDPVEKVPTVRGFIKAATR